MKVTTYFTKSTIFLVLVGVILVGTAVLRIAASNSLTTSGIDLNDLQVRVDSLKKENMILRQELYAQSSLYDVASRAATLGFVVGKGDIALTDQLPVAMR